MTKRPYISVIIAVPPGMKEPPSLRSLRLAKIPAGGAEVLLARGRSPAAQRNRAVERARGEVVYFLDDDARVPARNLVLISRHFKRKELAVLGGPDLRPGDSTVFELAVDLVQGSRLGSSRVRRRYRALSMKNSAGEADLILCNMAFRRSAFLWAGGFNEDLYPNEENELLNRLRDARQRIVYAPGLFVRRRRPGRLFEFLRQSWRYGRGRSEQFLAYPCLSDLAHYVPACFLFYLLVMPFALAYMPFARGCRSQALVLAPLLLYCGWVCIETFLGWREARRSIAALLMPCLYVGRHVSYALGTIWGLLGRPFRRSRRCAVKVTRVRL